MLELETIACTCEAADCSRRLTERERVLTYRTPAGERRAYECACGAVTVTVARTR